MPRAEHWSQLKAGIIAFVVIVVGVAAVLMFARVGALHGDTTDLHMVTDRAVGVLKGTEVWLAGQKVGLVTNVSLMPPSADTTERVAIDMQVLNQYMPNLRKNSRAQIRPGGNLIGAPVVFLSVGTTSSPPLAAGDTLRANAQVEGRPGVADISTIGDSVGMVATQVKEISTDFGTTVGEIGALRARSSSQVDEVRRAVDRFRQRATRSRGTFSLAMGDTATLRAEIARLSAVTDSLRATAASGNGTVGRFRRDSTLVLHARHTLATVDTLRARLARYSAFSTRDDSTLARELVKVHLQLDSLVQDAKHHPLRYLPF